MDAITRYSATDPVRFDIMNKSFDEIEKRDEELEEQINNLLDERGYENTKLINDDLHKISANGKYLVTTTAINTPEQGKLYLADAIFENNATGILILKEYSTGNKIWMCSVVNGTWDKPMQIYTNVKQDFQCTPTSGYKIDLQNCCLENGKFEIVINVSKSDGGYFVQGFNKVATLPFNAKAVYECSCMATDTGVWELCCNGFVQGNGLTVMPCVSNIKQIYLTVRGDIA